MKRWQICSVLAVFLLTAACASPQTGGTETPEATVPDTTLSTTADTEPTTEPTMEPATEPATEPTVEPVTDPATEPATVPTERIPVYTVCVDAGHQQRGIPEKEPNGPGSDVMKAKLTSGTQGVITGIPEYQLNLDVSLMLEQELLARGYQVVMIRRSNDCPLSNAERAEVANNSGADIFIRIHANGAEDPSVQGMLCCAPTEKNPYLTAENVSESIRLSQFMTEKFCARTGAQNRGLYSVDTMTGINWCRIPVTIVEMGYMSNPEEDSKMATIQYRQQMVEGIADGVDAYFGKE